MSAVDIAKQVADQAMPTAERINERIEKEAHNLSANAEFHASDVANEYQKGAKVWLMSNCISPYMTSGVINKACCCKVP